jgi:uncharacterized protein YndB with AHSA1/START domain
MNKTQITAEPGIPQVIITREFDAPRGLVFRAHTDPELLVQWLGAASPSSALAQTRTPSPSATTTHAAPPAATR